jgi:hypothetical protein
MKNLVITISFRDICEAKHYDLPPLVYALVQTTGTLWRISECGTAVEVMAPFRTFVLQDEALELWRHYMQTGFVSPHTCELQCHSLLEVAPEFSMQGFPVHEFPIQESPAPGLPIAA